MIHLPDVTLVAIDTVCHDLTRMALQDSMRGIKFGEVIVFSDHYRILPEVGTNEAVFVQTYLRSNREAEQFLWYGVPFHIKSDHFLVVQWDGFVVNPRMWNGDWLKFDYIGAPWWYDDGRNVGNGGFSLRSTRLAKHMAGNTARFPFRQPEDHVMCRVYGDALRKDGFKFADDKSASGFSFECMRSDALTFGFHAMRNFPFVLNEERLAAREAAFPAYIANKQDDQVAWMHTHRRMIETEGRCLGFMSQA